MSRQNRNTLQEEKKMENWNDKKQQMFDVKDKRVMIASHRGKFSSSVMENTSLAFLLAMGEGADMVEMDLALTKDGRLVGHHDATMVRLFHIENKISDFTLAELMELPLYNYVGESCVERLETFEEILDAMRDKALLVRDKSWDYWDEVYEVLNDRDMVGQAIFKFYDKDEAAYEWAEKHTDCIFVPMVKNVASLERMLKLKEKTALPAIEILATAESDAIYYKEVLNWIHENGMKVWCNSLSLARRLVFGAGNDDLRSFRHGGDTGWGKLIEQGVDIIQTDWPYEVKQYLLEKGL